MLDFRMNKSKYITLIFLAITVFFFIFFYSLLQRIDTYLKLKAMNDCALISRYQKDNPSDGTTVWYPVDEIYKKCVQEKGY